MKADDRSSDTYEDISPNQHFEPLRYVLLNRNLGSVVPSMISHWSLYRRATNLDNLTFVR